MERRYKIPNQVDSTFHIWKFITLVDVFILTPSVIFCIAVVWLMNGLLEIKLIIGLLPVVLTAVAVFIRPIKERPNIRAFRFFQWKVAFGRRQRTFLFMKKALRKEEGTAVAKKKPSDAHKLSAQDLIPIRRVFSETIETDDHRLVKIISVSAVNLSLMSLNEQIQVMEGYEQLLNNLEDPVQILRVSEPINMSRYIEELRRKRSTTQNVHKKILLSSYIDYAQSIQQNREMIRRNRFLVFDEKYEPGKEGSLEQAMIRLRVRRDHYIERLEDMLFRHRLDAVELTNEELKKALQIFYDYENAQLHTVTDETEMEYLIGRRNLVSAVKRIEERERLANEF
ncbi:hypothetical protein ACFQI7_10160 [Paenibacillus allorhizosphaerae]|uniref:Uncharacterized protein n=1 Tax=Paenibacillus allorhizosphaerae TaxID=2849866 RepID=A0ABM8VIA4_9BACL|nr:hypothetical protein [Paenibacillus allorhizosphaerae]CAG7643605.1 hypothetical protein PAECIP111802_03055 [Paenibacillus allorhizosphaerae]